MNKQMSQTIPGFYSTAAAAAYLEISSRGVGRAAQSNDWKVYPVGNVKLYASLDIQEYHAHQLRTELIKKLGWKGRGLYRIDDIDISCPVCECFAVEWPLPPYLAEKFICVNGHEGEL